MRGEPAADRQTTQTMMAAVRGHGWPRPPPSTEKEPIAAGYAKEEQERKRAFSTNLVRDPQSFGKNRGFQGHLTFVPHDYGI
jgi:hypothetical protein